MNKIINLQHIARTRLLSTGAVVAVLFVSLLGIQNVYAAITNSLDFGSTGSNVTELQTYLATNASIYPSGLITGYFGPLTQAAVQRFQAAQGIVSGGTPETTGYGRVGPQTMLRINSLMGSANNQTWDTVPVLSSALVQFTSTTATFTWTTNEYTQGQVYYDSKPLRTDEATGPGQQPYISGTFALDSGGLQTNHALTVQNLQPNTLYYYTTRGIDSSGNMSMQWPSTFRTDQ